MEIPQLRHVSLYSGTSGAILDEMAGDAGFGGLADGLPGVVRQDEDVDLGQLLFNLAGWRR